MSFDIDMTDLYEAAREELYFELNRMPTDDEIIERVRLYQFESEAYAESQASDWNGED